MSEKEMLEIGTPVRVLSGPRRGFVGKVEDNLWTDKVLVKVDGGEHAFDRDDIEPLYSLEEIEDVRVLEKQPGSDLYDKVKPFGMSSEDLSDFVLEFNQECQGRIKGVGKKQYDNNTGYQKFEAMELDDLLEYVEEEILDIPNYCAMLFVRIRRLRQALDEVDTLGRGTYEEYEGGNVHGGHFEEGGEGEASYN